MALTIIWSQKNFNSLIHYLEANWTEREVKNFVKQLSKTISMISKSPEMFRTLPANQNIREAVITKHNLLIYKIKGDTIQILAVFDTRQHLGKKNIR